MLEPGLVSVSFRQATPETILTAAAKAGLRCIEWGGDVHVPPGDPERAQRVRQLTVDAGLRISSYGSYFRIGVNPVADFPAILETATTLGAPIVRLWAYDRLLPAEDPQWSRVVKEAAEIAKMAAEAKIQICLECHNGTLTEEYHSTLRFLQAVNQPNLGMYWQPNEQRDTDYNLEAAEALAPYTTCVHVFYWVKEQHHLLADGLSQWEKYRSIFASTGKDHPFLLEFMPDNRLESLPREAATLLSLLGNHPESY